MIDDEALSRAVQTLKTAEPGSTLVIATARSHGSMVSGVHMGTNAVHDLVCIARSLLVQAGELAFDDNDDDPDLGDLTAQITAALEWLPDPDEDDKR